MRRPTRQAVLGAAALLALSAAVALAGTAAAVAVSVDRHTASAGLSTAGAGATSTGRGAADGATTAQVRVRPLRDGDVAVTADQLRASLPGASAGNEEWIQTMLITAHCMAGMGFYLDPRVRTDPEGFAGSAAQLAEYGSTGTGSAYRWQDAGCWGYAVHVMGNDLNH